MAKKKKNNQEEKKVNLPNEKVNLPDENGDKKEGIEFEDIFATAEGQRTEYFTILNDLINADKNLDLKTEINKPLGWSSLKLIEDYLGNFGLEYSQYILQLFTEYSFRYKVSKGRRSREEIIRALTHSNIDIQKDKKQIEIP
ncbi:MAG: hypothetical protein ACTSO2_13775 [Promethearchaeota archaeon]